MFKHAQLESVKTSERSPYSAFPLHARIQRAIRQLILDGALMPVAARIARVGNVSGRFTRYGRVGLASCMQKDSLSDVRGSVVSEQVRHLPKRSVRQRSGSLLQQARLSQRGAAMVQGGGVGES